MRFRSLIFIFFGLLLFLSCQGPGNSGDDNQDTHPPLDLSEWDSLQNIIYDDPQYFLDHAQEIINDTEGYSSFPEISEEYIWAKINMAYTLLTTDGQARLAAALYEEAISYNQQHDILSKQEVATYIYKPLGNCYTILADYEKAQKFILNGIEDSSDESTKISLRNNLGISLVYNDKYKEAIRTVKKNLNAASSTSNPLDEALSFNILSDAYYKDGHIDSASLYNRKAVSLFSDNTLRGDTLVWYCSSLEMQAHLRHQEGKTKEATQSAKEALRLLEMEFPDSRNREKAKVSNMLASLRAGNASLELYRKSIALLLKQNPGATYIPDYTFTTALLGIAGYYEDSQIDSSIYYYSAAIENDFRTQQLITSKASHQYNNHWNKEIVDKALHLIASRYTLASKKEKTELAKSALWLTELSKGRQLINEINRSKAWADEENKELAATLKEIQQLHGEITQVNKDQERQEITKSIEQALLQANLQEGYLKRIFESTERDVFFENLQGNAHLYLSVFEHLDSSYTISSLQGDQLTLSRINEKQFLRKVEDFKSTYFTSSPKAYNNNPAAYQKQAEHLLAHLAPQLKDKQFTAFISPDGAINGLPFDALIKRGHFLAEKIDFAYINSFIVLDILKPTPSSSSLAILYKEKYEAPFMDLPFVKEEVMELCKQYSNIKYGPDKQNIENISELFTKGTAIHIAAHTSIDADKPPTLELSKRISTDALQYYSISSPLIFLASCNTSSGEILSSEGIASLNRSFLSKGVPSVISTYWYANDQVMQALTAGFYKKLSESGNPISALASNKRDYLKNASTMMRNPWYWANINYHGVENSVLVKEKTFLEFMFQ